MVVVLAPPSDYLEKLSCIVRQAIRDHFALPSFFVKKRHLVFGYILSESKLNIEEISIRKPYYWPSNKSDMDKLDDTF